MTEIQNVIKTVLDLPVQIKGKKHLRFSLWVSLYWVLSADRDCSSILVLLESCVKTCMTYTIAECTVNKLLMVDRRTVRNM
jgi:hypothetical protein